MAIRSMKPSKVFGIGFQKTGTTSLNAALSFLGYRVSTAFGLELTAEELKERALGMAIEIAARHDAVEDMPWPLFFRELDAAFPGSRFILTVREPEDWYRSITDHFKPPGSEIEAFVYGLDAPTPHGNKDRYLEVFNRHNHAVMEYFSGRPNDLLIMDLTKGDGWDKLCGFLDEPIPSRPFPRRNTQEERRAFWSRVKVRLDRLFGAPYLKTR